jgi:hypothetical protein
MTSFSTPKIKNDFTVESLIIREFKALMIFMLTEKKEKSKWDLNMMRFVYIIVILCMGVNLFLTQLTFFKCRCGFYLHPAEGSPAPNITQGKLSAPRILRVLKVRCS